MAYFDDANGDVRFGVDVEHELRRVRVGANRHVMGARHVQDVVDGDSERHPALDRLVPEHQPIAHPIHHPWLEDAATEPPSDARVVHRATPSRLRPAFARLTTRDRSTTGAGRSNVTSYETASTWRCSNDTSLVLRIRACLPEGVAHTRSRVRTPLRMSSTRRYSGRAGRGDEQRLVLDVQLDDARIGHVDDRLTDSGQPVRVFGVDDRPRLVEAVDERARCKDGAPLVRYAPHAQIPVRQRECRFCPSREPGGPACLHHSPLVPREEMLRRYDDPALGHSPQASAVARTSAKNGSMTWPARGQMGPWPPSEAL